MGVTTFRASPSLSPLDAMTLATCADTFSNASTREAHASLVVGPDETLSRVAYA